MKKTILFLFFLLLYPGSLHSRPLQMPADSLVQAEDKAVRNPGGTSAAALITSSAFISYGITARLFPALQKFDARVYHAADKHFSNRVYFDDYLQYAPSAAVYIVDLCGIKAKNDIINRTFATACSHLAMGTVVQAAKRLTRVKRPDTAARNSFPSGHTAAAFTGAHILYKEYRDTPWVWITGYAAAAATGTLRVLNKRHWFSDVIAGAGTGILCAELAYLILPSFQNIRSKHLSTIKITPAATYNSLSLALYVSF